MKAVEFCYWLQGSFEIGKLTQLDAEQTAIIKAHLDMVFVHDIDKSYPEGQQAKLNEIHSSIKQSSIKNLHSENPSGDFLARC